MCDLLFSRLIRVSLHYVSDNRIGADGARALTESLKQNATLTQLDLDSMSQFSRFRVGACATSSFRRLICASLYRTPGNRISDDGAQVLAESLKQNVTLTGLILYGRSQFSRFRVHACMTFSFRCLIRVSLYRAPGNNIGDDGVRALAKYKHNGRVWL